MKCVWTRERNPSTSSLTKRCPSIHSMQSNFVWCFLFASLPLGCMIIAAPLGYSPSVLMPLDEFREAGDLWDVVRKAQHLESSDEVGWQPPWSSYHSTIHQDGTRPRLLASTMATGTEQSGSHQATNFPHQSTSTRSSSMPNQIAPIESDLFPSLGLVLDIDDIIQKHPEVIRFSAPIEDSRPIVQSRLDRPYQAQLFDPQVHTEAYGRSEWLQSSPTTMDSASDSNIIGWEERSEMFTKQENGDKKVRTMLS